MYDSLDNLDTNSKEDFCEIVHKNIYQRKHKTNIFRINNECLLHITNYLKGIEKAKLWLVNRDLFHQISGYLTIQMVSIHSVKNVNAFSRVHSLDLSYCRNITDVRALGSVHTLYLVSCDKITDVSSLGGVHTLNLSFCRNITDVSALGSVHTLYLSQCSKVADVSALGGVHTLSLMGCS